MGEVTAGAGTCEQRVDGGVRRPAHAELVVELPVDPGGDVPGEHGSVGDVCEAAGHPSGELVGRAVPTLAPGVERVGVERDRLASTRTVADGAQVGHGGVADAGVVRDPELAGAGPHEVDPPGVRSRHLLDGPHQRLAVERGDEPLVVGRGAAGHRDLQRKGDALAHVEGQLAADLPGGGGHAASGTPAAPCSHRGSTA
jgi:hypothetical protein